MGLLPCLRRGADRWWLPASSTATDAIGQVMLAAGRSVDRGDVRRDVGSGHATTASHDGATALDDRTRDTLVAALAADPPLLIYAALGWPGDHADLCELAEWFAENAISRFASGDAFLHAPEITQAQRQRFAELDDHFRTLPVHRWIENASLWLEVLGPKVPSSWSEQWPELSPELPAQSVTRDGNMLQQLARTMQRLQSLERSFDGRLHKSKLGALKQLAYGLSHEINNPLANISTRAQQLQRTEEDATRHAILQRIVDQVYRAHEMIADLMFYANPPAATRQRCDLNGTLAEVADKFREESERQAIRLEVKAPSQPTMAVIDESMIAEALSALVRNSIDAIGCEGTIVVSLVRHEAESVGDTDAGSERGGQIMIHVADSGPGLSDHARAHAFDPYFSGREAGRGLGLGLCRAYRIAKLHFGDVTLAGGPIGCVATITLNDFSR